MVTGTTSDPLVLIVAGEASGDMHAAALVAEMRRLIPSLELVGIGGDALAAQGLDALHHASEMTVVGFAEVVRRYRFLRAALRETLALARSRRPTVAILVDYPGFNLRLARGLHQLGIPVVYYIAPQVWAWKEGRVETLRSAVDDMIVAFPFEVDYFASKGISARFFGHPLVDRCSEEPALPAEPKERRVVAYLPGSRQQEITRHMPLMRQVIDRLGPSFRHVVPRAPTVDREQISKYAGAVPFEIVEGSDAALAMADAALVKAGTSTVEAALHGVPFASFYRTSRVSYEIARRAIRIDSITMVNLLAGEPIVREMIQKEATPDALERELRRLLEDGAYRARVAAGLEKVRTQLGGPGAASRAAEHIVKRFLS